MPPLGLTTIFPYVLPAPTVGGRLGLRRHFTAECFRCETVYPGQDSAPTYLHRHSPQNSNLLAIVLSDFVGVKKRNGDVTECLRRSS